MYGTWPVLIFNRAGQAPEIQNPTSSNNPAHFNSGKLASHPIPNSFFTTSKMIKFWEIKIICLFTAYYL